MRVFNLTNGVVSYAGRDIPPRGSVEVPGRPSPRDLLLEKANIVSFDRVPAWFSKKLSERRQPLQPTPAPPPPPPEVVQAKPVETAKKAVKQKE